MDARALRQRAARAMRLAETCGDEQLAAKLRVLAANSLEQADAMSSAPATQQQQQIQPDPGEQPPQDSVASKPADKSIPN